MKKLLVAIIFLGVYSTSNAGHFKVEVKNEGEGAHIITNLDAKDNTFSFSCKGDCDGIVSKHLKAKPGQLHKEFLKSTHRESHGNVDHSKEKGLRYYEMDKYVSVNGITFSMTDLILKYERRILAEPKGKVIENSIGQEAPDVFYQLNRSDNGYIIEIFTGVDAKEISRNLKE